MTSSFDILCAICQNLLNPKPTERLGIRVVHVFLGYFEDGCICVCIYIYIYIYISVTMYKNMIVKANVMDIQYMISENVKWVEGMIL